MSVPAITPVRLAFVCVIALFVGQTRSTEACSCAKAPAKQYMARASRVFVAMALPVTKHGKLRRQTLRILHTLKGPVTKRFVVRRTGWVTSCTPSFRAGTARIVFVSGKHLSICGGNYGFSYMRRMYAELLRLGKPKTGKPDRRGLQLVLERSLSKYLHARKRINVVYPPLAGHKLRVGRTWLRFVARPSRNARAVQIVITDAVASGPIQFVQGTFAAEGVTFAALVQRPRLKVINRYVVER